MKRNNRIQHSVLILAALAAALPPVLLLTGCGDFFATQPTEAEARAVLEDLSRVEPSPHIDNPLPEIYRQPPSRLQIRNGIKLFYFTKHHPAGDLAGLVKQQLGVDASVNTATNQLVLYCADDNQADVVEAYLEMIDVPPVQVNIDCLILERFGDITMDWETSVMIQDMFGEGITMGEGRADLVNIRKIELDNGNIAYRYVDNSGNVVGNANPSNYPNVDLAGLPLNATFQVIRSLDPAFPGASLREPERGAFGVDFGYWRNRGVPSRQFRAVFDVLISKGYLKVLLNPTLETVNAQRATVSIKDHTPIQVVRTGAGGTASVYNITEYVWVENTLSVTPHVYADGSIGLVTDIKIGSRSQPEGVIQRPIITERSINAAENRIMPGESLIIGGMRKSEKRSVIRGIPFFKDLPLLGPLFSSKDFEEKGTEIIFVLTPSISGGGQDHREIVQDIRGKYADPDLDLSFRKMLTEPFEPTVYTSKLEEQATEAELRRVEAEMDRESARQRAQFEQWRADRIAGKAQELRQEAQRLRQKADQAARKAQQAQQAAEEAEELSEAKRQRIDALQQTKDAADAEARQAQEQAAQAAQEAEKAALQAKQALEQLEQQRRAVQEATEEAEPADP